MRDRIGGQSDDRARPGPRTSSIDRPPSASEVATFSLRADKGPEDIVGEDLTLIVSPAELHCRVLVLFVVHSRGDGTVECGIQPTTFGHLLSASDTVVPSGSEADGIDPGNNLQVYRAGGLTTSGSA